MFYSQKDDSILIITRVEGEKRNIIES